MTLKFPDTEKPRRTRLAISLAIAIVAIVMIVLGNVLHSRDSGLALYAVPVFLMVGAAAIARPTLWGAVGDRKASGRKISSGLVAVSSAAILTIYAAGYDRTRAAADQFERQAAASHRRPSMASAIAAKGISQKPLADSVVPAGMARVATDQPVDPSRKSSPLQVPPSIGIAAGAKASVPHLAEAPAQSVAVAAVQPAADQPAAPEDNYEYADGTFSGRGTSRHGDVQVQLVIQADKIVSASVSKCMTQYSCDVLNPVYRQLVNVQNPDKIDNVTGATDSVDAYYGGVVNALTMAAKVKAFQNQYKTTK